VKCCKLRARNDNPVLTVGRTTKLRNQQQKREEENWDDQEKDRHFSWRCNRFLNVIREEEEEEE
jgi:hypothetical protein